PAHEHLGVVSLDGEGGGTLLLRSHAVERADPVLVVRAGDPAVVHAEPEPGRLGRRLDGIERGKQLGRVDAVTPGLSCDSTHSYSSRASLIGTSSDSWSQACELIGQVP